MEKPYWTGGKYWVGVGMHYCAVHTERGPNYGALVFRPQLDCSSWRECMIFNERDGFVKQTTTAPPLGGAKYSFVGKPNYQRLVRENPGADVLIVSREDGIVTFAFRAGPTGGKGDALELATLEAGVEPIAWETYHQGAGQYLPAGWVFFASDDKYTIKSLRQIAQLFVRARNGKHTVKVLPAA